jgi:transposase
MEATGVYWKPVWHILDDGEFVLVLANAAHVKKNVPGRKTDINDAMWLAELLAHGLIRASFVPDTRTQEMRNLLRTRKHAMPPRKIVMQRAARRKVLWDVPPLAAGAQDVHHAVHDGPHVDPPLTAATFRNGSTYAHSSSVRSLGYLK